MSSPNDDFDYGAARLHEVVEHVLRLAINSGEVPSGALLQEARIADQLDLSRAPVQQALRRLEGDTLVTKIVGRGYLVGPAGAGHHRIVSSIPIPIAAQGALGKKGGWERIYAQAEADIVGMMPFGRYNVIESAMADHFGVSRTVTHNLLSRLEERGLLEKVQRTRWAAPQLTPQLMADLYDVRRLLEPAALTKAAEFVTSAELAAMRDRIIEAEARYPSVSLDELSAFENDLHVEILGRCPNQRILGAIRQSHTPLIATSYMFQQYLGVPEDEPFLVEHRLVIELLLTGAPTAAAAALEAHMVSALRKGVSRLEYLSRLESPEPPPYLQLA